MEEKVVGKVIHYYNKAMVAVVQLSEKVALGDTLKIVKGESEFTMKVASMQINHAPVEKAEAGDEVAIKVDQPAKEGAVVYKVEE